MAMNIRNNVEQRIRDILKMVSTPPQLTLKGSVQPTIDIYKIIETNNRYITSIAGNVTVELIPGEGKKQTHHYGLLELANNNDANGDAYINVYIRDTNDDNITNRIRSAAIADNNSGALTIHKHAVVTGATIMNDEIGFPNGIPIWETDYLYLEVTNGQAADTFQIYLMYTETKIGRDV